MMNTKLMGALGEYTAARKLREDGYDIYSTNFATPVGEIDIVAHKRGLLCFVEVKTRKVGSLYSPAEAVDFRKQENIKSVAASYINKYKLNYKIRFDIFEVYVNEQGKVAEYNHITNAF
jgi:putative endonuclease